MECNPDDVTAELLDTYLAGGVNRLSFGVQSTSAHVLQALGRTHDRANVERSVELARAAGFTTLQPRPHLRRRRRDARRLVPHARRRHRLRPAARLGLRAHRRGRHAAGRRPRSPSRRRRPGRQVPRRHRAARRRRATTGTRSPTGPSPATSAATTSSTGRWASTRASAARPTRTATAAASGTSAPPTATSTPSSGAPPSRRPTSASTTTPARSRPSSSASAPATASPRTPSTPTDLDGLVEPHPTDPDRVVLTVARPPPRQRGRPAPARLTSVRVVASPSGRLSCTDVGTCGRLARERRTQEDGPCSCRSSKGPPATPTR